MNNMNMLYYDKSDFLKELMLIKNSATFATIGIF